MKNPIYIAMLIALLAAAAAAQTTVKAIDSYAKGIDQYTASKRNPKVVFADTSNHDEGAKETWREFDSEKALETHRETSEAYSIAYTWTKAGKLVASKFTLFSPSGDWVKYVNHYFRPDGTLAKAEVDYRTFHGDFTVEQNLYYSPAGDVLKKTTVYKDLHTGKPKKPEAGYLDDNSELLAGDIYQSVAKLPFTSLITKK